MKIIKEGQLPGKRLLYGTCNNCKTEFVCLAEEAKFHSGGRNETWYEVTCPLTGCNTKVILYS